MAPAPVKVLLLRSRPSPIAARMRRSGATVCERTDPVSAAVVDELNPDFLVSHGFGHIVPEAVLMRLPDRAINLHISYLPWNRGTYPNVWSWIDDTPKGVSIHHMRTRVDAGDIIAQALVDLDSSGTLRSTHATLEDEMQLLFAQTWPKIVSGSAEAHAQQGPGSHHRDRDLERIRPLLYRGWDTPVRGLHRRAHRLGLVCHSSR